LDSQERERERREKREERRERARQQQLWWWWSSGFDEKKKKKKKKKTKSRLFLRIRRRPISREESLERERERGFWMGKGGTKAGAILVRLVSTLDTGFFYVKRKNPKKMPHKLELKKYDAKARKHAVFVESKIK